MVKFNLQTNFLLRKISKEAPNFQLVAVVLSLELPVGALLITMQYSNIVTLVTRSLDESLGQSLGKIVRKSMGTDPMRDSFLALRDSFRESGRDWFPILYFCARDVTSSIRSGSLNLAPYEHSQAVHPENSDACVNTYFTQNI